MNSISPDLKIDIKYVIRRLGPELKMKSECAPVTQHDSAWHSFQMRELAERLSSSPIGRVVLTTCPESTSAAETDKTGGLMSMNNPQVMFL